MRARWTWRVLFAAIALVYLYFIPYYPALNNPNENSRVYQIRAAVELHKLSVNEQLATRGWVNDLGMRDGKYYAGKAPGTTFIGIPIHAALRSYERWRGHTQVSDFRLLYALRLAGTLLPTLLFVAWFRAFIRRVVDDDHIANALTIMLALGSMLLSYALIYVNHSLTAACAFGTVMATEAAVRARQRVGMNRIPTRAWAWLFLAGFLLSMNAALDYAMFPVSVLLLVWVPIRFGWRFSSIVALCAGASLPAIWTGVYHTICWGGPFKLSVSHLANPQFATIHSQGVFGIVGPSKQVFYEMLFGSAKGLLFLSPVFAFALLSTLHAVIASHRRKQAVLCLLVVWWMLLYNCSLANWDGGWTVGPRYMTVMVPFAIYSLALSWSAMGRAARQWLLPLVVGAGMLSVLVMAGTSVLFPHLPPGFSNPVYQLMWPLWRDGIVPYNLGSRFLHLTGRAAQLPMLIAAGLLLAYLVRVASGWRITHARWLAALASAIVAIALIAGGLKLGTLAASESAEQVSAGNVWLRTAAWYPPVPASQPR